MLQNCFFYKYITFSNMIKKVGNVGQDIVQDAINNNALSKLKGKAPTNGLVQDTLGTKSLIKINKNNDNLGFYNYLKYYVNHGSFASDYELEAIGKDKNGNYVFEYKNKEIEKYRKKLFKDRI